SGLVRLRDLTADRAVEQRRLDTLGSLATARLALLDSAVRMSRNNELAPAALQPPISNRGRVQMDRCRAPLEELRGDHALHDAHRPRTDDERTRPVIALAVVP